MKIMIDGDACNVIAQTEDIAKKYKLECHIFVDTSHILDSDYSEIHIVSQSKDAVDYAIVNRCQEDDIVITKDSGLAAMAMAKKSYVISPSGFIYDDKILMASLNNRYARMQNKKKQVKGNFQNNIKRKSFVYLLQTVIKQKNKLDREQEDERC